MTEKVVLGYAGGRVYGPYSEAELECREQSDTVYADSLFCVTEDQYVGCTDEELCELYWKSVR